MKVSFGRFIFDAGVRELLAGSRPLHLSPKAFEVLRLLIERRPNVVEKQEIYRAVWPNTFVGDATLNVVVAEIRRALGDDPKAPHYVRTAHRIGYAFSFEPVSELDRLSQRTHALPVQGCWLSLGDRVFPLSQGENIVGRDPGCAVWLDESGVSRRHARIMVTGNSATIEDLDSTNGTFVRNLMVSGPHELADGDSIRFGSTTLRFKQWSDTRAAETVRLRNKRRGPST